MEYQYQAEIITLSDGVTHGVREDKSGQVIFDWLTERGFDIIGRHVLPDERDQIAACLLEICDEGQASLIVTTGGTGVGPRDVTPEATLDVVDKTLPGMAEAMRFQSLQKTPFAMTSRQVVGVRNTTLIINLPGSPRAVRECLEVVEPVLRHVIHLIHGDTAHTE